MDFFLNTFEFLSLFQEFVLPALEFSLTVFMFFVSFSFQKTMIESKTNLNSSNDIFVFEFQFFSILILISIESMFLVF